MKFRRVAVVFLASVLCVFGAVSSRAVPSGGVVISQLQTGGAGTGTASQEFVEIYNNSASDIDVTGWCLTYSSASDLSQPKVGCLDAPDSSTRLWLSSGGYVSFASPQYTVATGTIPDVVFTYAGGMAGTAGHVRLVDAVGLERDKVAWGATAVNPEGTSATAPAGGTSLQRLTLASGLQDTDNNVLDFTARALPVLHGGGIYEVETVIDVCPNIDGAQSVLPDGYEIDDAGECGVDLCQNIGGLQREVPVAMELNGEGECVERDVCTNLDGVQAEVPTMYGAVGGECLLNLLPLELSELLPDALGSDTGSEFIELYNPNDVPVELRYYVVRVGPNFEKLLHFSDDAFLPAHSYKAFYNSTLAFTLVNTSSRVALESVDGQRIAETPLYTAPYEAESWASFEGVWAYTNRLTPDMPNSAYVEEVEEVEEVAGETTTVKPCASGQYRNLLTGRCRKIEVESELVPCKEGQYRSEETGRCRSIVATVANALKPCADDEFRNPSSNRCKKIASSEDMLQDCAEGYERNPATNRCRKVLAVATTVASPSAAQTSVGSEAAQQGVAWGWTLAAVAIAGAASYGIFEWRQEIGKGARVVASKLLRK